MKNDTHEIHPHVYCVQSVLLLLQGNVLLVFRFNAPFNRPSFTYNLYQSINVLL